MKKYLRQITYISLCLFLLNSGISVAAGYYMSGQQSSDGLVVICTSTGIKWVSIEELGGSELDISQKIVKKSSHDCPLCCLVKHLADSDVIHESLYLSYDLLPPNKIYDLVTADYNLSFHHYRQSHPRAPPQV